MSNPTTPFSWQMPTATDLVTDLPADFEVFGQAVATSMADLLGGNSGQILAKNSNTDMDFVWIANDQGDITGITATSPLTGGGTSGAVTVGIQDGTTAQKGAVQLENSTSSTSTTTAAVPASVKSAYDLANGAIPKSLIDAAGDLIVGTAADTAGRLGIGTANQVLRVNTGATALEWATASSVSAATQAEQETASSTSVYVSPGRQQYHPSAAKGWANFNGTSTYTINASYNVSSVSSVGTAQYRVNWDVDFSSANYAFTMNCDKLTTDAPTTATMIVCNTFTVAAGYMDFALMCVNGTRTESGKVVVTAFGDQ
jgi:hypothetical protein